MAGGPAWEAAPTDLRPATDEERLAAIRERNRSLNAAGSGGVR
ncbi:hypothetical protein [Streptomyces sp. NPDC001809]